MDSLPLLISNLLACVLERFGKSGLYGLLQGHDLVTVQLGNTFFHNHLFPFVEHCYIIVKTHDAFDIGTLIQKELM